MSESPKQGYQKAGSGTGTYSHGDFTFVRKKRGKSHIHEEEHQGELNIVPYLDIVINLIMFLLVAQATMVSLGMIDVTAPSYTPVGPGSNQDPAQQDKQLRLTVGIASQGFYIAARGGVIPGQEGEEAPELTAAGVTRSPPTVPRKADGSYDYPSLARKLRAIKGLYPDATAVYVAAEDNTAYEVIVRTLDASREDAQGPLFPNVAFSQIN